MSVFPIRASCRTLILFGVVCSIGPAWAQGISEVPSPASPRDASFLPDASASPPTNFSGLASSPISIVPDKENVISLTSTANSVNGSEVITAPLPTVSPESIGIQNSIGLGSGMWKGTSRVIAEHELALSVVTTSPLLNDLMLRLLRTEAVPPLGTSEGPQSLTALRIEKLVSFGDTANAWMMATHSDPKLVDDKTFNFVSEHALALNVGTVCPSLPDIVQARSSQDWQSLTVICQLYSKDTKASQVSLDVMRAQTKRDDIFLQVADKNILGDTKTLPHQLTPLTAPMLALLRLTQLPLPGELYGHPDFSLAPALLLAPAKEDVAQLGLAERAAQRGVITNEALADIYKTIKFLPEELSSPLAASESGSRQRALLFQAAKAEQSVSKRISYAVKFVQTAPPDLLNGVGNILADMLGDIKSETSFQDSAVAIARIYMLAARGDAALDWLKLARSTHGNAEDLASFWPQFVLAGLETDSDYAANLETWLNVVLKPADQQTDMHNAQEKATAVLLLLDAAGFAITDADWARLFVPPHAEKRIIISPPLWRRLSLSAADNHRAEAVLLAVDLANDGDISLPIAVTITHALRSVGLKSEAATFARQNIALLDK